MSSQPDKGTEEVGLAMDFGDRDTCNRKPETSNDQRIVGCVTVKEEGKDITSFLPEDVMEKIIARLPFRFLFQARLLARRWASMILSPGPFETFFSSEIMANSLSLKWDSFCPLYVCFDGIIGYNLVSKCWQKILSLSYLPISEPDFCRYQLGNIAGALISFHSRGPNDTDRLDVWVTNPLNQSWNLLHPFRLTKRSKIVLVHLERVGASAYKLIVVTTDHIHVEGPESEVFLGAQVYDSTSSCWTKYHPCTKKIDWVCMVSRWRSAHVNDTLYMMGQVILLHPLVVAYNMKDEIWSTVTLSSPQPRRSFWSEAVLFPCGSKMMIVNIRHDKRCIVYELNHESQVPSPYSQGDRERDVPNIIWKCSQLTTSQLPLVFTGTLIASDDRALYLCVFTNEFQASEQLDIKVFDVHEHTWSSLPHSGVLPIKMPFCLGESYKWAMNAFQPGLNPLVIA